MQVWRVQLLGGFGLRRGDQEITHFRTRAVDAIFAYLALNLGKPVSRDHLVHIGWPQASSSQGRHNLRTALSSIRAVLGKETLLADRSHARLIADYFVVDALQFRLTRDPMLFSGRCLEGIDGDWALPYSVEYEELLTLSVVEAMERMPVQEAQELAKSALRQDPSRLTIRAKLNELNGTEAKPHSGPYVVNTFFGRQREIQEVSAALGNCRLVTITGLGGSGKTRLAAEIWRLHQPESWFVRLADLNNPLGIAAAIRDALKLLPTPSRSSYEQVVSVLQPMTGLLILDNFEHLLSGAELLVQLLADCPMIRVLATSQKCLGLDGEVEYTIGPLGTEPETVAAGGFSDSAQLFEDRAKAVNSTFRLGSQNRAAVEELCRRLDGFPLAVEIAAAKSRVFTPAEMLNELGDRFDFLVQQHRPVAHRHASLRNALDWSFERLSEDDQALLISLSVFRGGFTQNALAAVCGARRPSIQLEALLSQSWVEPVAGGRMTRFRLLESIRDYGAELLTPTQSRALRSAHAEYYLGVAQHCVDVSFQPEEPESHLLVDDEIFNLDEAWLWLKSNQPEGALRLAIGLNWYWILKGQARIGEARVKEAFALAGEEPRPLLSIAYQACGNFILFQGRYEESEQWFHKARANAHAFNDTLFKGLTICQIAQIKAELGLYDEALEAADEAVRYLTEFRDDNWLGAGYTVVAIVNNRMGRVKEALRAGEEAVRLCRRGGYPWGLASALNELAMAHFLAGNYDAALSTQEESIALKRDAKAPRSLALSLADKAATLAAMSQISEAGVCLGECMELLLAIGETTAYPHLYGIATHLLTERRQDDHAAMALQRMQELIRGRAMTAAQRKVTEQVPIHRLPKVPFDAQALEQAILGL